MKKKKSNRKVVVFVSLVSTLTLTSALLLALAPAPLAADTSTSLFAVDAPSSLDVVFETKAPSTLVGRWKYIYIHHSTTPAGNASTLAQKYGVEDHFVIGNGDGCVDGEIQITQAWSRQDSITNPPAGAEINPTCISICLIGDFDNSRPTATQQRRLAQLVGTLQSKLRIPANHVLTYDQPGSMVGIGHSFPADAFRSQILP